ncbi:HlyD family efflux transporter periplasmic adaptor subunit [Rhodoferax sp.]|uniref:efflux RND transporter periplasmic adaptor subunit n=1 Tax=Rhodoferax sp. TaxID=50421 RepID=UPI001A05E8FF|nr:HlyD family efflux transporter periplasmic adaptor subunit [Rhodoferax sp.]MBE0472597.1 HlyD family efflux transporter periplasmic adaptor subunit [Rhodoferax sp.]
MTRARRWLLALLLVTVAVVLVWLARRAPQVEAVVLQAAPLVRSIQFSARVATLTRVDVGSTLTARVAQVLVREGDAVRAGDVLVQLETDELRAALAQQQASLAQAQARLQGLRSTGRSQAQAALAQAQATLQATRLDVERTRQLVAQGFLSPARLDDADRTLAVAQAAQEAAAAQVRANADHGTDLAQAQAQSDLAHAAVQAAQARLAQTAVRAPTDARVLSRSVEPGQIVQPGRALLALALAGPTQLKAQVDERFLAQLAPGQVATLVADAYADQRLAAKVLTISPAIDPQRGAVEVTLALDQTAPTFLREDMTLSVEVETARRANALALPLAALRGATATTTGSNSAATSAANDDSAEVLVAVDGYAQARRIRLGVRNLQSAEVLQGLRAGDVVLLGTNVQPGQRVRPRGVASASVGKTSSGNQAGSAAAALGNAMGR